jgi:hypothetical protein
MLVSEQKPFEEIMHSLHGERAIFILGCHGCAEASHTGGEKEVIAMRSSLEEAGKTVSGWAVLDFLCQKALVKTGLLPFRRQIKESDSLLVLCCGVGVQATAAVVDKVIHPGCNTLSMGGAQGEWRGSERCAECGECLLDYTGGICPITACTKSLINGICGGMRDGRCEHESEVRPCGWYLIYERLKKLDRVDRLRDMPGMRDHAKAEPPKALRSTTLWALEQEEQQTERTA